MTMALTADGQSTDLWLPGLRLLGREPVFTAAAVVLAVTSLPMLAALLIDDRTLLGINVWIKPLKFQLALFVYLLTLAVFARWLPAGVPESRAYKIYSGAVAAAVTMEMIWIAGAAANGMESHFNMETPLLAFAYPLMGGLAVFLTTPTLLYGWHFWRDEQSSLDPVIRQSLAIGLVLTFFLMVAVAGYMSGMGTAATLGYETAQSGHFVGGNLSDTEAYPLMGWAKDGGDLRVAHFFASHAMHFIPAFGVVAATVMPRPLARMSVYGFSVFFVGFVVYTLAEALIGLPFLSSFL